MALFGVMDQVHLNWWRVKLPVPPSPTKSDQVPPSPTKSHQVPPSPTKFHQAPPSSTKSHQVPPSPTKFHLLLSSSFLTATWLRNACSHNVGTVPRRAGQVRIDHLPSQLEAFCGALQHPLQVLPIIERNVGSGPTTLWVARLLWRVPVVWC